MGWGRGSEAGWTEAMQRARVKGEKRSGEKRQESVGSNSGRRRAVRLVGSWKRGSEIGMWGGSGMRRGRRSEVGWRGDSEVGWGRESGCA